MILCSPRRAPRLWGWSFNPSLGPALPRAAATPRTWTPSPGTEQGLRPEKPLVAELHLPQLGRMAPRSHRGDPQSGRSSEGRGWGTRGGGRGGTEWLQRCSRALDRSSPRPRAAPGSRSRTGPEGTGPLSQPCATGDRLWCASPLQGEAALSFHAKPRYQPLPAESGSRAGVTLRQQRLPRHAAAAIRVCQ